MISKEGGLTAVHKHKGGHESIEDTASVENSVSMEAVQLTEVG